MITLLNVSKGTRLLRFNVISRDFTYDGNKLSVYGECCVVIPSASTCNFKMVDPGYLLQGGNHEGQNDVEHLDFSGTIAVSSGVRSTDYHSPRSPFYPSVFGAGFGALDVERNGVTTTYYPQFFVGPTGGAGLSRVLQLRWDSGGPILDSYFHMWAKWIAMDKLVLGYTICNSSSIAIGTPVYCTVYRFSGNYAYYGSVVKSLMYKGLSPSTSWEDLMARAENDCYAAALTVNPTSPVTSWYTTKSATPWVDLDQVEVPRLSRDQVFAGNLNPAWGDLASDCYSQVQLWNGNGFLYGKDFVLMGKAARDTFKLIKDVLAAKNPVAAAKDVASLFLAFRYGWYLNVRDTISLTKVDYDRLYRNGRVKRSSSRTYVVGDISCVARCQVYCLPYSQGFTELERWLRLMDFDMTLENIWDMIPLSFVVDWFTGLGDLFNRMDQRAKLDKFHITNTGQSLKLTRVIPGGMVIPRANAFGGVVAKFYKRAYRDTPIPPSLTSYHAPNQKFDHWLEASSLIVQRL